MIDVVIRHGDGAGNPNALVAFSALTLLVLAAERASGL